MSSFSDRIQQDGAFFDEMFHLVPPVFQAPPEQTTDNKYTHSKQAASSRQTSKEQSKKGQKLKARLDLANYTNVLSHQQENGGKKNTNGGKQAGKRKHEDDGEDEEDDEDDDAEDDDEDEDMDGESDNDDDEPMPSAAAKKPSQQNGASHGNGITPASKPIAPSAPLYAGVPLTTAPAAALASMSADVGMDQLRQRLHERIQGLSNARRPDEHPFAKKRMKKNERKKGEKREKNEKPPSKHKTKSSTKGDEPPNKKAKLSASSSSPSQQPKSPSSSSKSHSSSDLLDTNDFQFAPIKSSTNNASITSPSATAASSKTSFTLQGKQQRHKHKSDSELLKEVESFSSRVSELKSSGREDEAKKLETAKAMDTALLRVQGIRVKDDAKLLKKSLKRDEKKKEKSRAEWADRVATQKSTQDAFHAAKIASANKKQQGDRSRAGATAESIAAEKAAEGGDKKGGRGGGDKKGGGRAGFEGKGKKFLN